MNKDKYYDYEINIIHFQTTKHISHVKDREQCCKKITDRTITQYGHDFT